NVGSGLRRLICASCTHPVRAPTEWPVTTMKAMKPHMPQEEKTLEAAPRTEPSHRRASHHHRQFEVMGAHPTERGTWFTVWAPNARAVGVIGSFNHWHCEPLFRLEDGSGRWSAFVEGAHAGQCY